MAKKYSRLLYFCSLGHHLLHPQNFDRYIFIKSFNLQMIFLVNVIVENVILGKESFLFFEQFYFLKYVNHQSGKTVKKFSCAIIYYYREKYRKPFYKKQPLCKIICTRMSKFLMHTYPPPLNINM